MLPTRTGRLPRRSAGYPRVFQDGAGRLDDGGQFLLPPVVRHRTQRRANTAITWSVVHRANVVLQEQPAARACTPTRADAPVHPPRQEVTPMDDPSPHLTSPHQRITFINNGRAQAMEPDHYLTTSLPTVLQDIYITSMKYSSLESRGHEDKGGCFSCYVDDGRPIGSMYRRVHEGVHFHRST